MKNHQIKYLLIFVILSNLLFSQNNNESNKNSFFTFNVGLNANSIIIDGNFQNSFTGIGIYIEPRFSKSFSIAISLNSMNVYNKNENKLNFRANEMGNTSSDLLLKWRWFIKNYALYPAIGFGSWSRDTMLGILGAGIEHNIYNNFYGFFNFYHVSYCQKCLDVGGGGISGNHLRLAFGLSYLFEIKLKPNKK